MWDWHIGNGVIQVPMNMLMVDLVLDARFVNWTQVLLQAKEEEGVHRIQQPMFQHNENE